MGVAPRRSEPLQSHFDLLSFKDLSSSSSPLVGACSQSESAEGGPQPTRNCATDSPDGFDMWFSSACQASGSQYGMFIARQLSGALTSFLSAQPSGDADAPSHCGCTPATVWLMSPARCTANRLFPDSTSKPLVFCTKCCCQVRHICVLFSYLLSTEIPQGQLLFDFVRGGCSSKGHRATKRRADFPSESLCFHVSRATQSDFKRNERGNEALLSFVPSHPCLLSSLPLSPAAPSTSSGWKKD